MGWGLALTISASIALAAAFFIYYCGLAAFRADITDLDGRAGRLMFCAALCTCRGECLFFTEFNAVLVAQISLHHLTNPIGQGTHAIDSESERTSAADADQLHDDLAQPVLGRNGRSHAQDIRDQSSNRF